MSVNASDRGEDEDRVAVIRTAQASCPVENAVSLQKTAPEKQTETPDIVNEELNTVVSSVGVIGTATVVAIAGIGHVLDVDEKNTQGTEKCTVHCLRDNPGIHHLVSRRPGKPGACRPGLRLSRRPNRRPESREERAELRDRGPLQSVLRDQDRGHSSVVLGRSVGFGSPKAA